MLKWCVGSEGNKFRTSEFRSNLDFTVEGDERWCESVFLMGVGFNPI